MGRVAVAALLLAGCGRSTPAPGPAPGETAGAGEMRQVTFHVPDMTGRLKLF